MAGMLPGVEAARRRRIHQSNGSNTCSSPFSSRRLSFSLFSTNTNTNTSSSASTFLGNTTPTLNRTSYKHRDGQVNDDTKLGALARDAKFRLDAKLRSTPLLSTTRNYDREERIARLINNNNENQLTTKKKKKNGKVNKFSWNGKTAGNQNHNIECAVCLDDMKQGDDVINLECRHSFHSNCLMPWLHTNAHCPCCRLRIIQHL